MNLEEVIGIDALNAEIGEGYIRVGKHPQLPLWVYCYTEKAVYENRWNEVTRQCRGLISGEFFKVKAFCMPKFFNASEHIDGRPYAPPLPKNEPFDVFDKVDGSLGTVFHFEGKWLVATKGGFGSTQAQWAQRWLDAHDLSDLPTENTYATEIIYPLNRIVVNNGDQQSLTLLAVFGNDGREKTLHGYGQAWERLGGTVVHQYPATTLSRILFYAQRNQRLDGRDVTGAQAEGYVIRYRSGLRVKVKFADYIRLHGIVTGLTERHVWEILRDGRTLDSLLEVLPDEYHDWLEITASMLNNDFRRQSQRLVNALWASNLPANPREFQTYAEDQPAHPGLFALYSLLSQQSWDAIKPEAVGPWKDHE